MKRTIPAEQIVMASIDLSLRSPAMVIFDSHNIRIFCFAQRQKDHNIIKKSIFGEWYYSFTVFPAINSKNSNCERYAHITSFLLSELITISKTRALHVRIEDYAYSNQSNAMFKLMELCGILKQQLFVHEIPFEVVNISRWKKNFTGRGNATKQHVYRHAVDKHKIIDLCDVFHHLKCDKNGQPPSPINDIYDSIGIAGIFSSSTTPPKKKIKNSK